MPVVDQQIFSIKDITLAWPTLPEQHLQDGWSTSRVVAQAADSMKQYQRPEGSTADSGVPNLSHLKQEPFPKAISLSLAGKVPLPILVT